MPFIKSDHPITIVLDNGQSVTITPTDSVIIEISNNHSPPIIVPSDETAEEEEVVVVRNENMENWPLP